MRFQLSIALLALAGLGCRSSSSHGRAPGVPDPTVELTGDPAVEDLLETVNARTAESNGRALLRMDLRNRSSAPLDFVWAVDWYDRSGGLVAAPARAWTSMQLPAGATRSIETPVPSPDATSWRLRAARSG